MARRGAQEALKLLWSSGAGLVSRPLAVAAVSACSGGAASQPAAVAWRSALQQARQPHTWQPWAQRAVPGSSSAATAASGRQRAGQLASLRHYSGPTPGGPSQRAKAMMDAAGKKSKDQGRYLWALVVGMVGISYAAVPLYRMFCQATGFGGTVIEGAAVEEKLRRRAESRDEAMEAACAAREVTVSFNADVDDSLPWRFKPTQRSVKVHPGQSTLAFYTAHNNSDKAITGISTYNVAPQQVGAYFNKIQCFCFEEQKLRPGETIDMPVFFYIDPEFALDQRLNGVNHITLSYTFFKVDEEDYAEEEGELPSASVGALPLPAAAAAATAATAQ